MRQQLSGFFFLFLSFTRLEKNLALGGMASSALPAPVTATIREPGVDEQESRVACSGKKPRKRKIATKQQTPHPHHHHHTSEQPKELDKTVSKRTAARQREAAANAEIARLKAELATLRAEGCPGHLAQERKREEGCAILPRRALSLAGFWNVAPNDLLAVTPALVAAVEARGGTAIRREGMQVCFRGKERRLVVESALEVMAQKLPQYQRRRDEGL
jgi:hypothetical protein